MSPASHWPQEEGVVANFSHIGECNLFLVPLDSDLLTMDLPLAFREYQLLGDTTVVYHAANAVMQLQVRRVSDVASK